MKYICLQATFTFLFCASLAYAQPPQPAAAVPRLVRFSGSFRPADGQPAQSVESVTLSVYHEQTGENDLWHEIQNVVVDADGHYSVLMGATHNEGMPLDLFTSGEPRWLGAQFNRPGEAEQPRVLLVSVPYALKAVDAETLGGKPASAYLLAAPAVGTDPARESTSSISAVRLQAPPLNSGQPNYIGKFINTTDLIDSSMYETGGRVGISTTAPAISLDVRTGSLPQMGIAGTSDYLTFFASDIYGPAIYWDPAKDMRFGKGGTGLYSATGFVEQMRIQSGSGNVGIGTQTPAAKLEVNGSVQADGNVTIKTSGSGLIFPDGTKQTTAGGGITGVTAGTDLTGGGTTGTVTLNLDTTKVPTLAAANSFTGSPNAFAGNVGIGTPTPGSKLDVAGDINFTGGVRYQGSPALQINSSPSFNVALGLGALSSNSSGIFDSAIGGNALAFNTTGNQNTAIGYSALKSNNAGTANTGTGNGALTLNTTGNFNTANGDHSLYNNTTGVDNTATGQGALFSNTIGQDNTANGYLALTNNTGAGDYNTATGAYAMSSNTNGFNNTATGVNALWSNTTGGNNTAYGALALYSNLGGENTAIGTRALSSLTSGAANIAVGTGAGSNLSGSNSFNIDIGSFGTSTDNQIIRIGDSELQSAFFAAGIYGVTTGFNDAIPVLVDFGGQLGTVSSSRRFKEDIEDMGDASHDLMRLRPVTFRYKRPFADGSKPIQYGLIAEEVAEVYPDLVAHSSDGQIETVKYQVLDSMLLNEAQRQQERIQRLEQQNQCLQERLAKLEAALSSISSGAKAPSVQ